MQPSTNVVERFTVPVPKGRDTQHSTALPLLRISTSSGPQADYKHLLAHADPQSGICGPTPGPSVLNPLETSFLGDGA